MGLVQTKTETGVETSPQLIESLHMAREVALQSNVAEVLPVHLVLAMLEDDESSFLLEAYGVDFDKLRTQLGKLLHGQTRPRTPDKQAVFSAGMETIMRHAREQAQKNALGEVDSNLVLAVILSDPSGFLARLLAPYDLDMSGVLQYLELREGKTVHVTPLILKEKTAPRTPPKPSPSSRPRKKPVMPVAAPLPQPVPDGTNSGKAVPASRPRAGAVAPPAPETPQRRTTGNGKTQAGGQNLQKKPAQSATKAGTTPASAPAMAAPASAAPGHGAPPMAARPEKPDLPPAAALAPAPAPAARPADTPLPVSPPVATPENPAAPSRLRSMFGKLAGAVPGRERLKRKEKTPPAPAPVANAPESPGTPATTPPPPAATADRPAPPAGSPPTSRSASAVVAPRIPARPPSPPASTRLAPSPDKLAAKAANNNQSAPLASTNLLPQRTPERPAQPQSTPAPRNDPAAPRTEISPDIDTLVNPPDRNSAPTGKAPGDPTPPPAAAPANRPARRRRTTPASLGAHESLSATGSVLEKGRLVENVPRRMKVNQASKAEVRITRAQMEEINSEFDDLSSSHIHELAVTEAMTVQLRAPGSGFHIENLSPQTQWIDRNQRHINDADFGVWRWNVTPVRSGKSRLQLVISARTVDDEGTIHIADIPDKIIELSVSRDHAQILKRSGLLAAFAIAGILLGRYGELALQGLSKLAAYAG